MTPLETAVRELVATWTYLDEVLPGAEAPSLRAKIRTHVENVLAILDAPPAEDTIESLAQAMEDDTRAIWPRSFLTAKQAKERLERWIEHDDPWDEIVTTWKRLGLRIRMFIERERARRAKETK